MIKKFYQILYYVIITPSILLAAHIIALFSIKIRAGILPRYNTIPSIRKWLQESRVQGKRILVHAASLGEFEHIKPLLSELKSKYNTINIVMFFSPSGYNYAKKFDGLDFYMYVPFDTPKNWNMLYSIIEPSLLIIAKHDIWPAQIWCAKKRGIHIYLINASLAENSSKTKPWMKQFLKHVYSEFELICAISNDIAQRFAHHYPSCRVRVVGDTKYDQVVSRKKAAQKQTLIPRTWLDNKWIFVAGSVWPEDEEHLFPALIQILTQSPRVKLIIVPHQPNDKALDKIDRYFVQWERIRFTQIQNHHNERILIVDQVGHLAGIYTYAHVAYVGGSFRQGIHNVMEPAIFGIPVLYGPVHKNSYEAIKLAEDNGGIVIGNAQDIEKWLDYFLNNDDQRISLGQRALDFATNNTGATKNLLKIWDELLI